MLFRSNDNHRKIEVKKSNYGATGILQAIEWSEGTFKIVGYRVLDEEPKTAEEKKQEAQVQQTEAEKEFNRLSEMMSVLRPAAYSPLEDSKNYPPRVFAAHSSSKFQGDVGIRLYKEAMERLMGRGDFAWVDDGSPSKPIFKLKRLNKGEPS